MKIILSIIIGLLFLNVMSTNVFSQVKNVKGVVTPKTPADPALAHTIYIVFTDANQRRNIVKKIKNRKSLSWSDLQINEEKCAANLKKYGLSKKSGEYELICIYDKTSLDGTIFNLVKSYQIVGDVVVLPDKKTVLIKNLK